MSEWFAVTQDVINQFCAATGDNDWMHVDPERAAPRKSLWRLRRTRILVAVNAAASRAVGRLATVFRLGTLAINYGFDRIRFTGPVPIGDGSGSHSSLLMSHRANAADIS